MTNFSGPIDWHAVFVPTTNVLEIVFRGSVTYLLIFIALRFFRREVGTRADLMDQLREQGVEDIAEVKRAFLETDGRLSVIKRSAEDDRPPLRRRPAS